MDIHRRPLESDHSIPPLGRSNDSQPEEFQIANLFTLYTLIGQSDMSIENSIFIPETSLQAAKSFSFDNSLNVLNRRV